MRCIGATRGDTRQVEEDERRTVPLGLLHISFNLNSFTRSSSGVMVAHLIPTWYCKMAFAASTVTWSLVYRRSYELRIYEVHQGRRDKERSGTAITMGQVANLIPVLQAQVVVLDIQLKIRQDKL